MHLKVRSSKLQTVLHCFLQPFAIYHLNFYLLWPFLKWRGRKTALNIDPIRAWLTLLATLALDQSAFNQMCLSRSQICLGVIFCANKFSTSLFSRSPYHLRSLYVLWFSSEFIAHAYSHINCTWSQSSGILSAHSTSSSR